MKLPVSVAALLLLLASPVWAQQPVVTEGTLQTRAATRPLDREFASEMAQTSGPFWIGYAVRTERREGGSGCWSGDSGSVVPRGGVVRLEGSDTMFVLYRIDERRVARIRMFSPDCALDAGGLAVHWLTGVRSSDSVSWLATFAADSASRRLGSSATVALAMHADPAAVDRLMALARGDGSSRVRSDALFWLAHRAGDKAAGTIADAIERDPDTEVKRSAVFALSQLPRDEGVPRLIALARDNKNPAVRKQAMFWLGQSGDARALRFFEEVLAK